MGGGAVMSPFLLDHYSCVFIPKRLNNTPFCVRCCFFSMLLLVFPNRNAFVSITTPIATLGQERSASGTCMPWTLGPALLLPKVFVSCLLASYIIRTMTPVKIQR